MAPGNWIQKLAPYLIPYLTRQHITSPGSLTVQPFTGSQSFCPAIKKREYHSKNHHHQHHIISSTACHRETCLFQIGWEENKGLTYLVRENRMNSATMRIKWTLMDAGCVTQTSASGLKPSFPSFPRASSEGESALPTAPNSLRPACVPSLHVCAEV